VQVVIALVVTPEGLPLAYEVPGNTADNTTLRSFLQRYSALMLIARITLPHFSISSATTLR
jgi:hypothetical protein